MADMQIDRMIVLSTNHIPWRTSRALDASTEGGTIEGNGDMPATLKWASYGWMVWADDGFRTMRSSDAHPELLRVIEFALKHGCQWIRLDCDGPEYPELPTFDWDAEEKAACPYGCERFLDDDSRCKSGGEFVTWDTNDPDEVEAPEGYEVDFNHTTVIGGGLYRAPLVRKGAS